jgi:cbb3-type cytochrome oxidase subunit 3
LELLLMTAIFIGIAWRALSPQRRPQHDAHAQIPLCDGAPPTSLSAPLGPWRGGEGRGEVGDSRALANTRLTLPALRAGSLPLPPEGQRGADRPAS